MCQNLASGRRSHPGLHPLANLFEVSRLLPAVHSEPDVAATRWHSSGNSSPTRAISFAHAFARRIVGAGLLGRVSRVAAASHGMLDRRMSANRMPARRGIDSLADVPKESKIQNAMSNLRRPVARRDPPQPDRSTRERSSKYQIRAKRDHAPPPHESDLPP